MRKLEPRPVAAGWAANGRPHSEARNDNIIHPRRDRRRMDKDRDKDRDEDKNDKDAVGDSEIEGKQIMTRRMAVGLGLCAWVFALSGCRETGATEPALVLTEAGVALAPVILFADAPPMTRRVAEELVEYIEKTSGARPELIEGTPDPLPKSAIWVGVQPVLHELFPELDFEFEHPEEILIAANKNHLVIAGRDRWDPEHMEPKSGARGIYYYGQEEYGTANAIYTFLQDYLDVRWLWQGEYGTDIIERERIAFEPFEYRFHPPIALRRGIYYWWNRPSGDHITVRGRLFGEWIRKQRLVLDRSGNLARPVSTGHGFHHFWDRYHETHPEVFALQPDGTRSGWPRPVTAKMCKSNPALWALWMEDVARQLEEDPTLRYFSAAANDNNTAGYCVCDNCQAWDEPDAPKRRLNWQGVSQVYVALSDRQVRMANELGRLLRERYPDKDYYVVIGGYGPSNPAPRRARAADNVIVAYVGHLFNDMAMTDRWSLEEPAETFARQISDWAATGARLAFRPNLPGGDGLYQGLPAVPFGRVIESFKHYFESNCEGFVLAAFWSYWPTQGPLYYMLAHLAWDPTLDGYAVLDDYYRRGFGPAYEQIKAYWTLMEDTRNLKMDGDIEFWEAYDEAFFARASVLLDEAETMLAGGPEKYPGRVAHVRIGLDYTRLYVDTLELVNQFEGGRRDEEVVGRLRPNLERMRSMIQGDTTYYMGPTHHLHRWINGLLEDLKKHDP